MRADDGEQVYVRAIGGIFEALPQPAIQRIEQFLYGSDAQWRVNQNREDSLTPLQRMGLVDKPHALPGRINYWASCEVSTDATDAANCMAGLVATQSEEGEVRLLVHRQLDPGSSHIIQVHSRAGLRTLLAAAGECETILTGLGALYLYQMSLQASPTVPVVSYDETVTHVPAGAQWLKTFRGHPRHGRPLVQRNTEKRRVSVRFSAALSGVAAAVVNEDENHAALGYEQIDLKANMRADTGRTCVPHCLPYEY